MKKTILSVLALSTVISTGLAQGYVEFSSSAKYVWDSFTTAGTAKVAVGTVDAVFLWTTNSTVASGWNLSATPTNALSTSLTWSAINAQITAGWNVATISSNSAVDVASTSTSLGGGALTGLGTQQFAGIPGSGTISVVVIGWDATAGTWSSADGSATDIGDSNVFTYSPGAASNSPLNTFNQAGLTQFGVAPAPEPSTIALAGLGVSALMALRRRSSK